MPDSKITALTSIGASTDPANDPLVLVDVSDTSMAATGTTKKVTLNNLLACSPTATLASATITGDLTVDTSTLKVDSGNDRVGIGTATPAAKLIVRDGTNRNLLVASDATQLGSAGIAIGGFTDGAAGYAPLSLIASTMQFGISGSPAMTLNSTGLGVGTASPAQKVDVNGALLATNVYLRSDDSDVSWGAGAGSRPIIRGNQTNNTIKFYTASTDRMTLDASGNVGIGVTPSAWAAGFKVIQASTGVAISTNAVVDRCDISANYYFNAGNKFLNATGRASNFSQDGGAFYFYQSTGTSGGVGSAITWGPGMTLDASGNLLVGTTTISPSINGAGAITAKGLAGITMQTVAALATDYTLPIGAFAGILTVRSNGGGGSAVWMLDPNAGAVQISSNIVGRTITFTFSGGSWKMQQTVGTVPSTYNYLVLATQ